MKNKSKAESAALVLLFLFILLDVLVAQSFAFRLHLSDKGVHPSALNDPRRLLSEKALERRFRHSVMLDSTDIPICNNYLLQIKQAGGSVLTQSKWLNTVVVEIEDSSEVSSLLQLPFVSHAEYVWKNLRMVSEQVVRNLEFPSYSFEDYSLGIYGKASRQIKMLKGHRLHNRGYLGKGVAVAVLDEGFLNADSIGFFEHTNIVGTRNFVNPLQSVYEKDEHGTRVLSCMAANVPECYVGTAPEADYWLLKTEDSDSEYPIEEDYWIAAAEYADSIGVDVIVSSLGYFSFDDPACMQYKHSDIDGATTHITKGAQMAANKGMLVFSSAGNEGNGSWGALCFPADGKDVFTIGSVDSGGEVSSFSSPGYVNANGVKPDAVAMGTNVWVVSGGGEVVTASGTSYSTPILAGLAICLWGAFPNLRNEDVISLLHQSSDHWREPTAEKGYGVVDINKVYKKAAKMTRED